MKKFCLLLVFLLHFSAFAIRAVEEGAWKKELGLNKIQSNKIEVIENRYKKNHAILEKQLKETKSPLERKNINQKMIKLYENKNDEILGVLYFWQKTKYKEILSRVY